MGNAKPYHDVNKVVLLLRHLLKDHVNGTNSYETVDATYRKIFLEDDRIEVALSIAEYMPLPKNTPPSSLVDEEETKERDIYNQFANELPGIYKDFDKDIDKKIKIETGTGVLNIAELERSVVNTILEKHKMWACLFYHSDERVRRIVASRIPELGNELSPLLNLMCTDPIAMVRDIAATKMNMMHRRSRRAWKSGTVPVRESILRVMNAIPGTQQGDSTLGWGTTHPSVKVRAATARMIDPNSPLWAPLVRDPSPRVTHEVALRIDLNHELVDALKAHGDTQVAKILARRRLDAYDPDPQSIGF